MNTYDPPTITDFEDVVRQMLQAENRLRPAIGTDAVQRRRREDVARMHEAVERVAADCVTDAERTQAAADETLAVGRTEDGTVVFYDLNAQVGVRRLIPTPPVGGGKSTHVALIDELALLVAQRRLNQARKGREL